MIQKNPEIIVGAVSACYGVDVELLRGACRSKSVTHARHVAMYLLLEHTSLNQEQVGEYFNGRDHTSVSYAASRIRRLLDSDNDFLKQVVFIQHHYLEVL